MQQKTEILFARCLCNSVHVCRACVSVCATLCGVRNEELKTVPRYHAHTTPVSLNSTQLSRPRMAGAGPINQGGSEITRCPTGEYWCRCAASTSLPRRSPRAPPATATVTPEACFAT